MKTLFLLCLLVVGINSQAQDIEKIKAAFNTSIEEETNKNYDRAMQAMLGAYSETSYEVNMRLGWLSYVNNKIDESIKYYKKASLIKPTSTEALWGLASPLSIKQKWVE